MIFRKKTQAVDYAPYSVTMHDSANVLEVDNLHVVFTNDNGRGTVKAVDGVSFAIPAGKTVALVGESGCGKSATSLSIMQLLPEHSGRITEGQIRFNPGTSTILPVDLVCADMQVMQSLRGSEIGMIFQEPMTSLNPVFTIGAQIDEAITAHCTDLAKEEIRNKTVQLLATVGIPRPSDMYSAYPHELSGGMRQRVMIAMALSCNPRLIIADEPTTALDVTVQAQILDLMQKLKSHIDGSIFLITHDLGIVAEIADYIMVMYAGRIVEKGTADEVLYNPLHPYTKGLLQARPVLFGKKERLYTIPGSVSDTVNLSNQCYFASRCSNRITVCNNEYPPFVMYTQTHGAACQCCGMEAIKHGFN